MVNEYMVCVDRIVASSCLRSVNELGIISGNLERESVSGCENGEEEEEERCSKIRECRICQDEDDEHSLEAPCACNGTLKFAHRICIQKWCNKKGDITCEICSQVFTPNYSVPPPRPIHDLMAVDISQMWVGFQDHHLLALAAAERRLLESEYDDAVANAGNITCLRSMAIVLMLVLLIHQVLMITRDFGLMKGYSAFFHFQVSFLQLAGFLLPCYVLGRSWYILQTRRRRQVLG